MKRAALCIGINGYGCSEGEVSYELDELGHGVFSHALLRALRRDYDCLDANTLADETADNIRDWCKSDLEGRSQVAYRYYSPSKERIVLTPDKCGGSSSNLEPKSIAVQPPPLEPTPCLIDVACELASRCYCRD